MQLRDHTFLGMTQSLCPECLALVPAKIITKGRRVYFRKRCPTHGVREDFVCSDVALVRPDGVQPARQGARRVRRRAGQGLPLRLRPLHRARAAHLRRAGRDHVVVQPEVPDVLRLQRARRQAPELRRVHAARSTGWSRSRAAPRCCSSPAASRRSTPSSSAILEYACAQPIDIVMINTNGIRLAHDPDLLDGIARHRHRLEVYFQFDGFDDDDLAEPARRAAGRDEAAGDRGAGRARASA